MPTLPTMTTKKMKIKGKILEILRVFTFRGFFAYHEFSILDFAYQDFSGELRACTKSKKSSLNPPLINRFKTVFFYAKKSPSDIEIVEKSLN